MFCVICTKALMIQSDSCARLNAMQYLLEDKCALDYLFVSAFGPVEVLSA